MGEREREKKKGKEKERNLGVCDAARSGNTESLLPEHE